MKKTLIVSSLIGAFLLTSGTVSAGANGPSGGGGNTLPTIYCGSAGGGNSYAWPGSANTTCSLGNNPNFWYAVGVTSMSVSSTSYNWVCTSAGVGSLACSTVRNNWCGTAKNQSHVSPPTSNLCAYGTQGTVSASTNTYSRSCSSSYNYGGSIGTKSRTDYCSAPRLAGQCGSANGTLAATTPSANLCNAGTASIVLTTGTTTYNWTCSYGGLNASNCSASKAILTPECTNATYAAADLLKCQNTGTCDCYTIISTGATSFTSGASTTYTGKIAMRVDGSGLLLSPIPGAGGVGAFGITYNGATLSVGVGTVGMNTNKPGVALEVNGLVHISSLAGTSLTRTLNVSSTGMLGWQSFSTDIYRLYTGSNATMYSVLPSNWRFGIGTITPAQKLDIAGIAKANSFMTSSDRSLKKDISPLSHSLSKILALNPVSFRWKDTDKKDIGFIAQDVEPLFPDLVTTDNNGIKSVQYSNLLAQVAESIQEINDMVETLSYKKLQEQEEQIELLEQHMQKLEKMLP